MLTYGPGGVSPVHSSKVHAWNSEHSAPIQHAQSAKYDSAEFSSPVGEQRFYLDLVGRLTQEVRAANTIGDIQSLRDQVAGGGYTPDPMSIAARMLLLGDAG